MSASESINVNGGQGPVSGPSYFYEDEVFRVLRSGDLEFGMVTENWELYSSDSDESDEERSTEKVPKGHVAVTWHPSGREDVVPEAKVQLSDRSLMPGDVVRRLIAGKDTQRGYARNVRVNAVVQTIGSKVVIPNISASSLTPVQALHTDIAVYLDSWIGTVRDMRYRIGLRFNDKSTCMVDSYGIAEHFEDTRRGADGFGNGEAFYPGQRLRGPMKYLRNADWSYCSEDLKRAKDRKLVTVIVTRVESTGVSVQWQWQTPLCEKESTVNKDKAEAVENKDKAETMDTEVPVTPTPSEQKKPEPVNNSECTRKPPPDLVTGDDMKRIRSLNLFDSCTVQLGDISFYTPSPNDTLVNKKIWKRESNIRILDSHAGAKSVSGKDSDSKLDEKPNESDNEEEDSPDENESANENETSETNNKMECLKKEGPVAGAGTTKKSLPKVSTRALRKKKLKKARQPATVTINRETQLVVETIHTSSSVDVVWQDGSVEENMLSIDLYPIHHLDDHEFFPGDFIVRAEGADPRLYGVIQRMDHNARVALVRWFETYTAHGDQRPKQLEEEEMSVYDIKDHPDFRFRPGTIVFRIANLLPNQYPAGQILDNYPDGQVRVWWANHVTSACWPQDLYRLGDYDSDGEIWDDDVHDNGDGASSDDSWETDNEEEQIGDNESPPRRRSISALENEVEILSEAVSACTLENIQAMVAPRVSAIALSKLPPMEQFVLVEAVPEGHRYRPTVFQPSNSRNFLKTIQREISLLRDNLPKGVIVKGYEDRMDLFSVLIHGPDNTPYEDGIFLFDIMLPANYPDAPPLVHYVSFCSNRLNPNLYECGKVCVSLLGTWSGKGTEVWTAESSLLQLLVSIQGLILVDEPYYNEAGYEKQRGSQQGEENSRMYNEMVLIKLVQAMSAMLTHPHAPWEKESVNHIRLHGPQMIERYRKWLSMSEVVGDSSGSAAGEPELQPGSDSQMESEIPTADEVTVIGQPGFSLFPVSKGFAISLKKTLNKFELLCKTPATPSSSSNTTLDQPAPPVFPQIPANTSE